MNGPDDEWNIVALSGREHFICHLLLTKIYPENTDLVFAFNNMFMSSDNQERYMPASHWYEYRRKVFVENHPLKDPETKKKHKQNTSIGTRKGNIKKALKWVEENPGAHCDLNTCDRCGKITNGNTRKYCGDECRLANVKKPTKSCLVCRKQHSNKYCCSKECMDIYKTLPDNEYSKTLSSQRSKYIEANPEKIKEAAQKGADKKDWVSIGKTISETKQINKTVIKLMI